MIEFKCPECGQLNEVSDRKAGELVRCIDCDGRIEVPDKNRKKKRQEVVERLRARDRTFLDRDHLTTLEFILAIVICFAMPCGVVFGIILYYVWNADYPTKAYQVLQAATIALVVSLLLGCMIGCLGSAFDSQPRHGGRFGQIEAARSRPA